jgi:hypothetical protein
VTVLDQRLARLRGSLTERPHDAATLAALTANPGCRRRAVLDAAGIRKSELAERLDLPHSRPSLLARQQARDFEEKVLDNGGAELLALLRPLLGLGTHEVRHLSLQESMAGATQSQTPVFVVNETLFKRTRAAIVQAARRDGDAYTLMEYPVLRLMVAGSPVFLEPDTVAFQAQGQFHVVEIRPFSIIDGQADPAQVTTAVIQAAVHVLALQELLAEENLPTDLVSHKIILVGPKNFSRNPTAVRVDIRNQLTSLHRQLERLNRIADLIADLPDDITFDVTSDSSMDRDALTQALSHTQARYTPSCRTFCDLALHCREEARSLDLADVLGEEVRSELGPVDTLGAALALAEDRRPPAADQQEIAAALRRANALLTRLSGGA